MSRKPDPATLCQHHSTDGKRCRMLLVAHSPTFCAFHERAAEKLAAAEASQATRRRRANAEAEIVNDPAEIAPSLWSTSPNSCSIASVLCSTPSAPAAVPASRKRQSCRRRRQPHLRRHVPRESAEYARPDHSAPTRAFVAANL